MNPGTLGKLVKNETFDQERSLYGLDGVTVENCTFAGPADGESPLKECRDICVKDCRFELRYPFWHVTGGEIRGTELTETCRAALWYDSGLTIADSKLGGIKALRECDKTVLENCEIISHEFAWKCRDLSVKNCSLVSEYPFLELRNGEFDGLTMQAKYSFQYAENVTVRNSKLKTKDAFWHSKNVTVYDSVVEGEYLAWYSENLRLVRCTIIGTQPLCYAKNLVLEDCEMIGCDLSFERSDVQATVKGSIDSVKNPLSGSVTADAIGGIIDDGSVTSNCTITVR